MSVRYVPENVLKLEHWQQPSDHRSNYLPGLAVAVFREPDNDRNSHYFARELYYHKRYRSAIREFERHVAMQRWPAERAQSLVYMGHCYGNLGQPERQAECYLHAFLTDPTRREALIHLAWFCRHSNRPHGAAAFAAAAMELPWHGFYANNVRHYRAEPYELRYWGRGWIGNVSGAAEDILKALEFEPGNPQFLHDTRYYLDYADPMIEGWMTYHEMLWLYQSAKDAPRIAEIGSWKGRSTHALLAGSRACDGKVFSVDHFQGSVGEDEPHQEAREGDIYKQFLLNTAEFAHRRHVVPMESRLAADRFPSGFFDLVFIDGSHDYESVKADIQAWMPKAKRLLCGHDYTSNWPEVVRAVHDMVGKPDEVYKSIWVKQVSAPEPPRLLQQMRQQLRENQPFAFVKLGDGEQLCMDGAEGANCDGQRYSTELAAALREAFGKMDQAARRSGVTRAVHVVPFAEQSTYNCLLHRCDAPLEPVIDFWKEVAGLRRPKLYVGPHRKAAKLLRCVHIEVPKGCAWEHSERIWASIKNWLDTCRHDRPVLVFSAGLAAKVWINKCLEDHPECTCIDAGSAFDPIFEGMTRTQQLPAGLLRWQYADLMGQPLVSIIIPTLGREDKLERLLREIPRCAEYDNYEIIVKQDQFPPHRKGVPYLLAQGVAESFGDIIVFLGNDVIPRPGFLRKAVDCMREHFPQLDGVVGLNDGYWTDGRFFPHFLIGRRALEKLGGEIFHLGYRHVGCDNELCGRAAAGGFSVFCREARIEHEHPSVTGKDDPVYQIGWNAEDVEHDRKLLLERAQKLGFDPLYSQPEATLAEKHVIPKYAFSVWLGEEPPALVELCRHSHRRYLSGDWAYEVITDPSPWMSDAYLAAAVSAGKWAKAADRLRLLIAYERGGVYLDSDIELLRPIPDEMLQTQLFCGLEWNNFLGNSIFGAVPRHPLLKRILDRMEQDYKGDDDLVFESGMYVFTDTIYPNASDPSYGVIVHPEDVFFPYNHQSGKVSITERTIAYHHYLKFWTGQR